MFTPVFIIRSEIYFFTRFLTSKCNFHWNAQIELCNRWFSDKNWRTKEMAICVFIWLFWFLFIPFLFFPPLQRFAHRYNHTTMPLCSTHTHTLAALRCAVSVLQQLNIRMASIGKAFSWITRTLLGTESPANLDRFGRRCRHSSNSLASKTNDNFGPFFLFS